MNICISNTIVVMPVPHHLVESELNVTIDCIALIIYDVTIEMSTMNVYTASNFIAPHVGSSAI